MTIAKAKTVASAIIDAGYQATVVPTKDAQGNILSNGWIVKAHSRDADVPLNTVKTLQDAQAVTGVVRDVVYS